MKPVPENSHAKGTPQPSSSRPTTHSSKRTKTSPIQSFPVKDQAFKRTRNEENGKKLHPATEKILWANRASMYKSKYGRNLATDSEGEQSESAETAKLFKNLSIPKKGANSVPTTDVEMTYRSPLDRLTKDKPKNVEDLYDFLMGAFKLTNNTILTSVASLQMQVDNVSSGVRTNTRAILRTRKELLDVKNRLLDVERQQLTNTMLVYEHRMGWEQLKSWSQRQKTIAILMEKALAVGSDANGILKVMKTEVRFPRNRGPGTKIPPIKVFFPAVGAMEYLTTVIQYPSHLRTWHKDEKNQRGSLPKFSIKPNVSWWDRQRAIYTRQVIENLKKKGIPSNIRYDATPYGHLRKVEDGQSKIIPFEKMVEQFANFLLVEEEQQGNSPTHPQLQEHSFHDCTEETAVPPPSRLQENESFATGEDFREGEEMELNKNSS